MTGFPRSSPAGDQVPDGSSEGDRRGGVDDCSGVDDVAVVGQLDADRCEPPGQLRFRRIVVAEVGGENACSLAQHPARAQPVQHGGQRAEVEVPGSVLEVVAEGGVDEHDVDAADLCHRRGGKGAGVGGVQQARAVGSGDLEQQGLDRQAIAIAVRMGRGQGPSPVLPSAGVEGEDVTGRDRVQDHGGVRADPVPAQVERMGWCPHVQRRGRAGPGPGQQERRVEMIGMPVRDEHVLDGIERHAEPAGSVRGGGTRIDEDGVVDQRAGRCPGATSVALPGTGATGAERIGPSVGGTRAQQGDPHRTVARIGQRPAGTKSTGASKAALRDIRRSAVSTGRPATRISTTVSAARGMS